MLHLQSRLEDFELIKPGRNLLKEGEFEKLSRTGSVQTRYLILLSDSLLYTYYIGIGTSLKVGYTIPIGDLQVKALPADRPTEFEVTSSVTSFTIRAK